MPAEAEPQATRITSPHDRLFRALISNSERADHFIRACLTPQVRGRLSEKQAVKLSGSFIGRKLREGIGDGCFRMWHEHSAGSEMPFYVLLEHKSQPDRMVGIQIGHYAHGLLLEFGEQQFNCHGNLPEILAFVFYNGSRRWQYARPTAGFFGGCPEESGVFPLPGYVFVDSEALLREGDVSDPCVRAVVTALSFARQETISTIELARVVRDLPADSRIEMQTLEYMSQLPQITVGEMRNALQKMWPGRWREIMPTIAETFRAEGRAEGRAQGMAEGRAEGRAEGMAEGRAEGRAEGMADILESQLETKFGELPPDLPAKIRGADYRRLGAWLKRLVTAETLEEVFAKG